MKRLFLLLLMFLFSLNLYSQDRIAIKKVGAFSGIELEKNYKYVGLDANEHLLVWYEMYKDILFLYEIKNNKLNKIKLIKGRGPHEILQLSGVGLSKKDIIYLVDPNNIKLIRLMPHGNYLKDQIPPGSVRPMYIEINDGYKVIMDLMKQQTIFFLYDGKNYIPIESKYLQFNGPFEREGYLTIQNNYLIHLTMYYPYLYIYNLENRKLVKKIKFDESEVEKRNTRTRDDGARMMFPPSKVDILSEDVARIPGVPGRIFILAQGKSENRDYDLHKLYVYDYIKEKFIRAIDLDVKAEAIAVNDNYLFVYSKEDYKIYKYKIVHSE